jgi:site-specific recombinase XerD
MSIKLILKSSKIYANGKSPVLLRVIKDRKAKYFKIGDDRYTFEAKQWSDEFSLLKRDKRLTPDYEDLNDFLSSKFKQAQALIEKYEKSGKSWTLEMFEADFLNSLNTLLIKDFIQLRIKEITKLGKYKSAQILSELLILLQAFYSNSSKLSASSIDYKFIEAFHYYLHAERGNSNTTIGIYLRALRSVLNEAINRGIGNKDTYPFSKMYGATKVFKISQLKTSKKKKYIPKEYILKLYHTPFDKPHLNWAKNLFLFSFFAGGINFKDMAYLTDKNLKKQVTENIEIECICFNRSKTNEYIQIPVSKYTSEILQWGYLNSTNNNRYLLPIISNLKVSGVALNNHISQKRKRLNNNLKTIAKSLSFPEGLLNITTYYARHSYATTLLKKGAQVELIREALGHKNIKTTQDYLDSFGDETLLRFNEDIL